MTVQGHLRQARHNEALASQLGSPPIEAYDWAITILFYSVLHFVDAYLLQQHGIVPRGHSATLNRRTGQRNPGRNDYVNQHLPLISSAYRILYDTSRLARYEGTYLGQTGAVEYQRRRNTEFAQVRAFFRQLGW
jgi:uncharacterized protein (UPF0332 family)